MATSSTFKSVDEIIALALSVTEEADSIDRAYMKDWVYEGLKQIGPNIAWYAEATIYPTELQLEKPKDLYSAIDIALYDSNGSELRYVLRGKGRRTHVSDNSIIDRGEYAPDVGAPIDLSEDAYYFNLGSNGTGVAYAVLKYWKFPVDSNGDLLIPEEDSMALVLFCKYLYYMRKDDKVGIGQFKNMWIAARNEARAAHNTPSMLEGTEIARSWNSMIQKMRFKKF